MKLFDTRWIGAHGIGRFANELYNQMPDFSPMVIKGHPASAIDPLRLRRYLYVNRPSLFFSPGYNAPFRSPCPFVFCVHDLNHLYIRKNSSLPKRVYYKHLLKPAIYQANVVITVSEFSRNQICEWSGVQSEHVEIVGNGVSEVFQSTGSRHQQDGRPYFLCVGNYKPHKNWARVLEAFANEFRRSEFLLVFSGYGSREHKKVIEHMRLNEQVVFAGDSTDERLATIYRGAVALIFVSLYEGFGLPIVEAMACGTPVLTSNVTAAPEVAGDAALLADPLDIEAISHGMRQLADDSKLRDLLRDKGLRRAKLFSWRKTGERVRAAIDRCV